jgi:ketosteroid isomerase-like protein
VNDSNVADKLAAAFASFDARDVAKLASFVTDDVRLRLGNAPAVQGKAAFVDAVNAFLGSVAGVHHEILDVYVDGQIAVVEFDVQYDRQDGKAVTIPCCNVLRVRGGLISEYRSYIDATPVYATA